ncbi:MAG: hypothetical protein SFV54_18525 [Bryobacteraceae bacterium]|nr:hypothetical protein [Bryobacteraceae bacterium]
MSVSVVRRKRKAPSARVRRGKAPTPGSPTLSVLHLTLHREFFLQIADGTKRIEYRARTPYWRTRLEGRHYDVISFRNGYASDAPVLVVAFRGLRRYGSPRSGYYAILLGRVLQRKRFRP